VTQPWLERRCMGVDVHRDFVQVAIWQGGVIRQAGRFPATPQGVRAFAQSLGPADEVALEVTGKGVGDRDGVGQSGRAGGGVQSGEDSGDR
jgi:hypothetical protein